MKRRGRRRRKKEKKYRAHWKREGQLAIIIIMDYTECFPINLGKINTKTIKTIHMNDKPFQLIN